ncbi:uncharacterized protein B0H18DRAFT_1136951 [Fomitopsis serialis]|uniref:uncharacterized protein n=1 Tax=Fomitopsis serialis TaxID=139415 RepID=UPI002007E07D|nr:uncharacterized protein B0H18DRAFT_1136951 [Neoantrodia serialis]KAH9916919.1 hypothetical protein B0H18DRAFT_1136951 [Neoantrodia serialis]
MNVLVYSGPEVVASSLSHCITSLRIALGPNYAVQSVTRKALSTQAWLGNCALLVLPACKSTPVDSTLSSTIEQYVQDGGRLLTIGATVKSSDTKISVAFEGGSLKNALLTTISLGGFHIHCLPFLGSFQGVDSAEPSKLEPIAHVVEDGACTGVATTKLSHGKGSAIFCAILIDHPLTDEPLLSRLTGSPALFSDDQLQKAEAQRQQLLRSILQTLDLVLPEKTSEYRSPLPQFLTSSPSKPWIVDRVLQALSIEPDSLPPHKPITLQDSNDTFHYQLASAGWETPLFDTKKFYDELARARRKAGCKDSQDAWGMGEALFYGEVVTSTQTMIDKNTHLLSTLPAPLVSLASHQLAGRGRGANVWLSPSGCLQFSLLLRVSLSEFPASKLVFVQYLFGLAVVEACRDEGVLGEEGRRARLKWPNDVYVVTNTGEKRKIGGILVNTSFSGGKVEIVIGSGLNVFNPPPIQSLLQLVPPQSSVSLTMERTAAIILTKFEDLWGTFLYHKGSFEPFLDLYYDRWLHSDQLVELTTVTPPQMVRIVGITSDHEGRLGGGGSGTYIDLQPDGNSFDLMAGLIKAKT